MTEESLENEFSSGAGFAADLKSRVVRGGFWVFALRIVNRFFGLARTIILARLLAPTDFGLFGIALLTMSALETFSQTGFGAALIQTKKDIQSYLDTAWMVQVIRSAVLAAIIFASAPYVAVFFNAPLAKSILRVTAFSVFVGGFSNIGIIYFRKELEFRKAFVLSLSGTLADISVAILAALLLRNVWALVMGFLAGNFVQVVVSYFIHPYRPRLRFDSKKAKELFNFGRWILSSTVLIFLIEHGDDILLGKLLGTTMLGLYQVAYRLSNLPAREILGSISQVTFPAYSKLQGHPEKLQNAYLRVLSTTAFISMPLAGGIFLLAPEFTELFLGNQWMPMVPTVQVLVIFVVLRCFGWTVGSVFQGIGRPDILTKLALIQLLIFGAILYPLTVKLGMLGTAVAVVIPMMVNQIIAAVKIVSLLRLSVTKLFKSFFLPLGLAALMVLISMVVKSYFSVTWTSFIVVIILSAFVYLGGTYLLNYRVFQELLLLIKGAIS